MAREKLGELYLLAFFPLVDLPFVVRRYLDRLRPQLYITTEAELWPNIQSQCRARDPGGAGQRAALPAQQARAARRSCAGCTSCAT